MKDYRAEWFASGKLFTCPNKPHDFKFGNLLVQVIFAKDCWSVVTVDGSMQNYAFAINTINWLTGQKAYGIIIWKMKIIFGFVK